MKHLYTFIALIFITFTYSYSQLPDYLIEGKRVENKVCNHIHKHKDSDYILAEPTAKTYQVDKYKLYLDWYNVLTNPDMGNHTFSATNTIELTFTENSDRIRLDAQSSLFIDSIFVNGTKWVDYAKSDEELVITLDEPKVADSKLNLLIHYTFSSPNNVGFYLYSANPAAGYNYNPETIAYTTCEPTDSRYWFPCNDMPSDKALVEISGKVPTGFSFVSNGLLVNTEEFDDYSVFHWKSRDPMATYLMVADASKYVKLVDEYTLLNDENTSIELQYYVWAKDTVTGGVFDARKAFNNFPEVMKLFEEAYGSFPFEKYAQVTVAPFAFGGMEHQSATTIHRNWLAGQTIYGIVHELAHQWLGDLITCNSWQDIWINEGGATWSEALFYSTWNELYYREHLKNYRNRYISDQLFNIPINGVDTYRIFGSQYTLAYYKAGWFYHMMSEMIGRDNFLAVLRFILDKYKFQSVSTEMFKTALKEFYPNPQVDWDLFFEQWLEKPGHPYYEVGFKTEDYSNDSLQVSVSVNQSKVSADAADYFTMPLKFELRNSDNEVIFTTKQFLNNKKSQAFDFIAPKGFNKVNIDTMSALSQGKNGVYSLVESTELVSETKLYPNVLKNGEYSTLLYKMPAGTDHSIGLIDLNGRYVKTIYSGIKNSSDNELGFSIDNLSSGIYFIQITSQYGIESKELFIVE